MRIKRVEIIGFKSFCDRSVINLDSSITAVVGPNGCGKSNIVDAIRWCMGEQSAKHLRGKAMEDVIFAGSETRGPAPMAEVSLTFDEVGFSQETLQGARLETDGDGDADDAGFAEPDAALAPAADGEADASVPAGEVFEEWANPDAPGLDFARFNEVTITRRLYRDGSSHYLINKTPCRLRDVTDFFLGTGVGTKAYSIIEQGRIGQIVSSRPQDRRAIIEEAAGITKFKTRKKAAEKKLDQTKQNLLRVSDIVSELDKRMGTLRRQAQKAERFRAYKGELRELELWKGAHRHLELRAEEGVAARRLAELGDELLAARSGVAQGEAAVQQLRELMAVAEQELAHATEAMLATDSAIALTSSRHGFASKEHQDLTARNQQALLETSALRDAIEHVGRDAAEARIQAEAVDKDYSEAGLAIERHQGEVATMRATLAELEQIQRQANHEIGVMERERDQLAIEAANYDARRAELAARHDRIGHEHVLLADDLDALTAQVHAHERELADRRQIRLELGEQESDFAGKLERLGDVTLRLESETETLRTEAHRRRSRLQSLEEIQRKLEGWASGTRAVMHRSGGQPGVVGLVADAINVPSHLEAAAEAVLGSHVEGVLVEDLASGVSAAGYLKQASAGRATFVPVAPSTGDVSGGAQLAVSATLGGIVVEDRVAEAEAIAKVGAAGVLGDLCDMLEFTPAVADLGRHITAPYLVVDTLERAVALRQAGMLRPLVTLEGDVVDARGVLCGGSRDTAESGLLAQKREIRELTELTEQLDRQLTDKSMELVTVRTERKQLQLALDALRAKTHAEELALMSSEKDLGRLRADLDTKRQRQVALSMELTELAEAIETGDADVVSRRNRQAELGLRLQQGATELARVAQDVIALRGSLELTVAAATDAKVAHATLAEKRTGLQQHAARLARELEDMEARQQRIAASLTQHDQRAAELVLELETLAEQLQSATAARVEQGAEVERRRATNEANHANAAEQEQTLRQLRATSESLASERTGLELKRSAAAMGRQVLGDAIAERYQVDLEKELHGYHLRPPVTQVQELRIGELRDLLDRMGTDINLLAIDEYNEVAGRFEFLSSQKTDLETAVAQLERAIDRMNKTSRKLFKDTFHQINTTFKEVFPRLFRGGQASLSLTGGESVDLLEAGVEIMAQPPGKKNSTVDQLSGGEKALTAVALVFSIFLIKPSPFCILDEVDAPLDEANVDRYNEIVREMTDRSQFIIITHNKRTMETADNLYGVTMQEAGVSKLVTVNLQRVGVAAPVAAHAG